ncbi:hypothetical protein AKO1_007200 [Acrasis kona]|uniref:Uncharacterized protein n=1 Tax=Acrasis kona TaxID=1008807 RepID=A0AAW2YTA7_9EUKA
MSDAEKKKEKKTNMKKSIADSGVTVNESTTWEQWFNDIKTKIADAASFEEKKLRKYFDKSQEKSKGTYVKKDKEQKKKDKEAKKDKSGKEDKDKKDKKDDKEKDKKDDKEKKEKK